jgi:hypothetical protein
MNNRLFKKKIIDLPFRKKFQCRKNIYLTTNIGQFEIGDFKKLEISDELNKQQIKFYEESEINHRFFNAY